jgi:hypothetical protein
MEQFENVFKFCSRSGAENSHPMRRCNISTSRDFPGRTVGLDAESGKQKTAGK